MAGKTKSMSLIKQLLLLKKQGFSNRKAAGMVGMDKETVNNYVHKAKADPLGLDGLLKLDFMEIIEDRHGRKATVIVSQLPVSDWYDILQKNTTAADAILDRLVHTAVRLEFKGDSMRRKKTGKENADREK